MFAAFLQSSPTCRVELLMLLDISRHNKTFQLSIFFKIFYKWKAKEVSKPQQLILIYTGLIFTNKVFRKSFSETITIFFNRLKGGFILVRMLQNFHQWFTINWSLSKYSFKWNRHHYDNNKQKTLKSISLILSDLDLLLKIRHQELKE